jgi:3-dehydroquinate dehydratase-2
MKKILIIHGPNLNLLGQREPNIYGNVNLSEINKNLEEMAKNLNVDIKIVQSNHEGEIVETIHQAMNWAECIIINPAAYTHTSIAIRDAIAAVKIPTIEVHLSNIYSREDFRQKSFIAPVAIGSINGFGEMSYYLALEVAAKMKK